VTCLDILANTSAIYMSCHNFDRNDAVGVYDYDLAELKETIAFITVKLDELLPIRQEITYVLNVVKKLGRDCAEMDVKVKTVYIEFTLR